MRSSLHRALCTEIRAVPFKKTAQTIIEYLEKVEMNALLNVSLRRRPPGSEQPVSLSSDLTVWLRWLMDGVLEIITGRERRRRWSTAEKLRIVEESTERGAVMRAVAARNGVCESLLYAWRRQIRDGTLRESETPAFVPVRVFEAPMNPMSSTSEAERAPSNRSEMRSDLIEIELGDGRQVRVGRDVNLAALRRVLTALRS